MSKPIDSPLHVVRRPHLGRGGPTQRPPSRSFSLRLPFPSDDKTGSRPSFGLSLFLPVLSLFDLYLSVVLATIHKRVDIKLSSRISIGPRGNLCAAAALLLLFPLSLSLHFKADDGGRAEGGRESDEKSKAVVAVREEGERDGKGFAAGSDEGDRQRVTFAEKRIISLETERVRI